MKIISNKLLTKNRQGISSCQGILLKLIPCRPSIPWPKNGLNQTHTPPPNKGKITHVFYNFFIFIFLKKNKIYI